MGDDEPWKFWYPEVSREFGRAIGDFFIAWGVLERELDAAFPVLLKTDPTLAACIYANLTTKAKLDILSSALSMWEKALPSEIVEDVRYILARVREYSDTARNVLAHAQPTGVGGPKDGELYWQFARSIARKKHEIVYYPTDTDHWRMEASMVAMFAETWMRNIEKIYRILSKLTPDEVEEICVTSVREIEPKYQRPRKPQPPKKAGLKDRRPSRGKPRPSP
ncbi:MAG: hypothetical protein AB7T86_02560 [Xanthobacteraceae bacterium]|uniref:hypothetical protein n=1 Tax=Pseudolabrys sp. TaxID=1960880 RepID=UPI003D0E9820